MIVDSENEYKSFINDIKDKPTLIIPLIDKNVLCVSYVLNLDNMNEYVCLHNHHETIYSCGMDYFLTDTRKITYDTEHIPIVNNFLDLNLYLYFFNSNPINVCDFFLNEIDMYEENKFLYLSTSTLIGGFMKIKNILINCYNTNKINLDFIRYNEYLSTFIKHINSSGIYYDGKLINSNYNFFTKTNRPTNSVNRINFIGLEKNGKDRELIKSRFDNGIIIEFDYVAYHLQLIANLIDNPFSSNINIHDTLGQIYFNKSNLNEAEYKKTKEINFKILYGHIPSKFKHIPFFNKMDSYINGIWEYYCEHNYVNSHIFNRKITLDGDVNKGKVFNYYLQAYEVEQNLIVSNKIINLIKEYKSKYFLYVHDSFLIDFNLDDGKKLIKSLCDIISIGGKYSFSMNVGDNYKSLKKIVWN